MHLGNRHTSPCRPITPDHSQHRHFSFKPMWMQKLLNHSIFVRDESRCPSPDHIGDETDGCSPWPSFKSELRDQNGSGCKDSQRPVTGLPRAATFKRQNSERRERLCPVEPLLSERRTVSASRHASTSCVRRRRTRSSPPPVKEGRASAPAAAFSLPFTASPGITSPDAATWESTADLTALHPVHRDNVFDYEERPTRPISRASSASWCDDQELLQADLDTKWILNLSMHFRDKSDREKFFVTYAETPTRWRRVTVSCDYRHAEPKSLEMDLKELQFQRDKSLAIYEAIHESLPEIQFYETVTNLKLETSQGRLHVHVTEDVNEIIQYPPRSMVRHVLDDPDPNVRPMELCERDIAFDSHLSGFVYRVYYEGKTYIKKEIPSPDTIDEFLYEINALHALSHSTNVIKLEAIILDDTCQVVKGLLISYAEKGAVVDILYDNKGLIPWSSRQQWAHQAVIGLRDVHEEGYVQGDFTLSNVVVDENNDAKIIDINRRGCPVGWEPPEIAQKIASNQRISMYIGEKSDIYQLGMTLWALAMDEDEPERHGSPLPLNVFPEEVPLWFQEVIRICLAEKPRDRLSAKELVKLFPTTREPLIIDVQSYDVSPRAQPITRPEPKFYIDPNAAVERDDLERFKHEALLYSPHSSKDDYTFTYPRSSEYDLDSCTSALDAVRGRDPIRKDYGMDEGLRQFCNDNGEKSRASNISPNHDGGCKEIKLGSKRHSVHAATFNSNDLEIPSDIYSAADCSRDTPLLPTLISKSSSPFRIPDWKRSASENTPRNSRSRMLFEAARTSPQVSPRSTSFTQPMRSHSAGPSSANSSAETIPGCDASVGDTVISGTTVYTQRTNSSKIADLDNIEPRKQQDSVPNKISETAYISEKTNEQNDFTIDDSMNTK